MRDILRIDKRGRGLSPYKLHKFDFMVAASIILSFVGPLLLFAFCKIFAGSFQAGCYSDPFISAIHQQFVGNLYSFVAKCYRLVFIRRGIISVVPWHDLLLEICFNSLADRSVNAL
jgi:hypothetical protein